MKFKGWHLEAILERHRDPVDGLVMFVVVACITLALSPLLAALGVGMGLVHP